MNDIENRIIKGAKVQTLPTTSAELALINRHTTREFATDELFTFKIAACDNAVDRDFERFTDESLVKLATLLDGKPVIFDHSVKASNQTARIYHAEVTASAPGKQLVARCYMPRLAGTADLITEIEAGIKKEVSISCQVAVARCSICGMDNRKVYCAHIGGHDYNGTVCHFTLEDPTDAYEVSFVAVPAQPNAGVVKNYGGERQENPPENAEKGLVAGRLRSAELFIFTQKQEE